MTTKATAPRGPQPPTGYSENTSQRILAFLASVQPYSGATDAHYRGSELIERMAVDAANSDYAPGRLTAAECADVLHFLATVRPRWHLRSTWWDDPTDEPSDVCGYHAVLGALRASLEDVPMEVRQ